MKVLLRYSTLAILLLTFGWLAHTPGWEPAILLDTLLAAWSDAGETGCGIAAAQPERMNSPLEGREVRRRGLPQRGVAGVHHHPTCRRLGGPTDRSQAAMQSTKVDFVKFQRRIHSLRPGDGHYRIWSATSIIRSGWRGGDDRDP